MKETAVPREFLAPAGSPREPGKGIPSVVFRYDLVWEFVSAIAEGRDAVPGFDHGAAAQAVADAVLESFEQRRWVEIAAELG
jgi:predicted dehydrogenase